MKEFSAGDYLTCEADIAGLLESAIEHHDESVLIRCIQEIAKLKKSISRLLIAFSPSAWQ